MVSKVLENMFIGSNDQNLLDNSGEVPKTK
jgi:hypothetical protein